MPSIRNGTGGEKVAGGGNLLLDIGPTADGRIPVIQQQRLLDMGSWLGINGEAIYETRMWKGAVNNDVENVYFTKKGNDLYVLCTEYPEKRFSVKGIKNAGKVTMLGFEGNIQTKKLRNRMTITPPELTPATNPSPYAWVFKIENSL